MGRGLKPFPPFLKIGEGEVDCSLDEKEVRLYSEFCHLELEEVSGCKRGRLWFKNVFFFLLIINQLFTI